MTKPPIMVCDLIGGGCGEATGEVAPRFGPLAKCPRCGAEHGLIYCSTCHSTPTLL